MIEYTSVQNALEASNPQLNVMEQLETNNETSIQNNVAIEDEEINIGKKKDNEERFSSENVFTEITDINEKERMP